MTPFEVLIKSWEDKAKEWRRVARQQRSECRGQTKMRLLEKAQLAEDCANELKALLISITLTEGAEKMAVDIGRPDHPKLQPSHETRYDQLRGRLSEEEPIELRAPDLHEPLANYAGQTRTVLGRVESEIPLTGETVGEYVERKREEYAEDAGLKRIAPVVIDQESMPPLPEVQGEP